MKDSTRDTPAYRLTRHFFDGLFDLGFLSESGTESFERMIIGVCAMFFSFGLLITRVFMAKYASLSRLATPAEYQNVLLADHAFVMALPMWIVAFVTVLVSHSLFPDETDFRVLMALPVTQRLIFGTKLLALALFTGLFIVAAHVALTPLLLMMLLSTSAEHAFPWRAIAFLVASLSASTFAVLAVTAVNGLLVLWAPRGRLIAASAALRSAMLCVLVLALPFLSRLPAQAPLFARGSRWLLLAPPAWFVAVERVLLVDFSPYFLRLALLGGTGLALATLIAAGVYAVLYQHFDRVMLRPADGSGPASNRRLRWRLPARPAGGSVYAAIRAFTEITLRRSVLHQGVLVCMSAVGAGIVVNVLIVADAWSWFRSGGEATRGLVSAAIWAPFVLIFTATIAVRAALVLPIEPRANWVFRVTEQDAVRVDQLRAAIHTVTKLGVGVPVLLVLPLQWSLIGPGALIALAVTALCGLLFVEILMKDWARIPFTCSYIPGKRFVPQTVLIVFVSFVFFTTIGMGVVLLSLTGRPGSLVPIGMLVGLVMALRWRRIRLWKQAPLEFEDQLPTEVNPLPSLR